MENQNIYRTIKSNSRQILCIVLFFTASLSSCSAQDDNSMFSFSINYSDNSCTLSAEAKATLDRLSKEINENTFAKDSCYVIVSGHFSKNEYKQNKFIGVSRAKEAVDYLVTYHNIKRAKFFLDDMDSDRGSMLYRPLVMFSLVPIHKPIYK